MTELFLSKWSWRQAAWTACALVAGLVLYLALERAIAPRYDFSGAVDARIPFLPWTWCVYVAYFPFVVAAAAGAERARFDVCAQQMVCAFVIAMGCFMLWPEVLVRPPVEGIENAFLRQRIARLWWLDAPANGFPSLHVALTCLACRWPAARRWRRVFTAAAVPIVLSTLTLKQHTVADVLGGLVLAASVVWLVKLWRKPARAGVTA